MARTSNAVARHKKKKRLMKAVKGQRGGRSKLLKIAKDNIRRSLAFSYAHRKKRAGDFRKLWITRISAACKMRGLNYSTFMNGLSIAKVELNRKQLSQLAIEAPATFDKLVEISKAARSAA